MQGGRAGVTEEEAAEAEAAGGAQPQRRAGAPAGALRRSCRMRPAAAFGAEEEFPSWTVAGGWDAAARARRDDGRMMRVGRQQ